MNPSQLQHWIDVAQLIGVLAGALFVFGFSNAPTEKDGTPKDPRIALFIMGSMVVSFWAFVAAGALWLFT